MKGSTPSFHWALRLTAGTLWPWATTVIGEVKLSVEFECSQLGPPKAREVAAGSAVLSFVSLRHLQRSMASSAPVRESRSGRQDRARGPDQPASGDSLAVMTEPRLSKIAHFS
jgi:hypothetical protein